MSVGRWLRPTLAGALVLTAVVPFWASAGAPLGDGLKACSTKGQIKPRADGWTEIMSPPYATGEGEDVITASAVSTLAKWVYVTNGTVVQLSRDAGCKWDHIYPAPAATDAATGVGGAQVVTHLATPSDTTLWIAGHTMQGGVARPFVSSTPNATPAAGNTTTTVFTPYTAGLPTVGTPIQLLAAKTESTPTFAYVVLEEPDPTPADPTGTVRRVYRTVQNDQLAQLPNGPKIVWEQVPLPTDFATLDGIAKAPGAVTQFWAWSGSRYAMTIDAGKNWVEADAPGKISTIEIDRAGSAHIYSASKAGPVKAKLSNGDAIDKPDIRDVPAAATATTHARRGGVLAISANGRTYGFDVRQGGWADITPQGSPAFSHLRMAVGGNGSVLLGQTPGALYRFDLYDGDTFLPPPPGISDGRARNYELLKSTLVKPVIKVSVPEITVKPGERKKTATDLGVGPAPSPLDVFFLMDTTMSMAASINDLKANVKQIARELEVRTLGSACFGLGEFKDFTATGNPETSRAYRRHMPITCSDNEDFKALDEAVHQLKEAGGSGPEAEGATLAMETAATGKQSTNPPLVGEDLAAGFTAPTRVIVLITDAAFMEGSTSTQGTYPSIERTADTLRSYGDVKVVSILVLDDNDAAAAREDMEEIGKLTDTLAPAGGVDCDGNKVVDGVEPIEGEPLICETDGFAPNLAPAIVGLLLGVKDPGVIQLDVTDEHDVIADVDGKLSLPVNLRVENHLPATFTVTCSQKQDGLDLPVTLRGIVRERVVVEGEFVVKCRAPVIPPPPPPPVVEPVVPEPPEAPRPPILLPPVAPAFQPPAPNNPISNVNPNAGFSQQEEQQFQLAPVSQGAEEDTQEETEEVDLAMVGVQDGDAAAAVFVFACAGLVSAGAGAAFARRRRTQTSLAYNRIR